MSEVDLLNELLLTEIFEQYGYPGYSLVGSEHNACSLLMHHMSIDFQLKFLEKNADYYGCFYVQIAGFNPSILPKILDLIYSKFNLNDDLYGYPNKEFRKTAYLFKRKELSNLVSVFEAGKVLYSIKSYEQAAIRLKKSPITT